jgi:hypothetical protein
MQKFDLRCRVRQPVWGGLVCRCVGLCHAVWCCVTLCCDVVWCGVVWLRGYAGVPKDEPIR